eukprot:6247717-Prymnesium_polylepis.2
MYVSPVCPWQCLLSRPADSAVSSHVVCREPGLELGGGLFTAHRPPPRRMVYTVRATHTPHTKGSSPRGEGCGGRVFVYCASRRGSHTWDLAGVRCDLGDDARRLTRDGVTGRASIPQNANGPNLEPLEPTFRTAPSPEDGTRKIRRRGTKYMAESAR